MISVNIMIFTRIIIANSKLEIMDSVNIMTLPGFRTPSRNYDFRFPSTLWPCRSVFFFFLIERKERKKERKKEKERKERQKKHREGPMLSAKHNSDKI